MIKKKKYAYQLDHIFILKHQLCHTTNHKCQKKIWRAHNDHAALCDDFHFLISPLLPTKKEERPPEQPKTHYENQQHYS